MTPVGKRCPREEILQQTIGSVAIAPPHLSICQLLNIIKCAAIEHRTKNPRLSKPGTQAAHEVVKIPAEVLDE
jgi:hypothetical protein